MEAEKALDTSYYPQNESEGSRAGQHITYECFSHLNFNDCFYALNFMLCDSEEEGFRLKALAASDKEGELNNKTCRIVSKAFIAREKETIIGSEVSLDSQGNEIEPEYEMTKVGEVKRAVYFQYRIDSLDQDCMRDPKIIIGLCRGGDVADDPYAFASYMELSKTAEVWAMNLNTGDKLSNKRWTSYYNLDKEDVNKENAEPFPCPKYGFFTQECVVGIAIDMDRGIMSFYKDGHDLGQAFVDK
jgi:hypothetical protein